MATDRPTSVIDAERSEEHAWLDDVYIVDTDVHIHEPPELIAEYMDPPYRDVVGEYEYHPAGTDGYMPAWRAGTVLSGPRSVDHSKLYTRGEQVVADLERLYIDAGVLFPYAFLKIAAHPNVDYATKLARAYNDYQLDRFLDTTDDLVGTVMVAPQDPRAAAEEIGRVGPESDVTGVFLPISGVDRPYGHPTYEPIWEAASAHDLTIAFHGVGLSVGDFPTNTHKYHSLARHTMNHEFALISTVLDIVCHGVPLEYPDLEFAFLEGGLAWVPMAMHRLDREWFQHRDSVPALTGRRPSDVVREFYVGTQPLEVPRDPEDLARLVELTVGTDQLIFAADIPHHDFDHPIDLDKIPIDRADKAKIWGETARDLFDL